MQDTALVFHSKLVFLLVEIFIIEIIFPFVRGVPRTHCFWIVGLAQFAWFASADCAVLQ